jgi:hypothetical protein
MLLLNLTCPFPDDLLTALGAGALTRVERSATETGTYAEIGTVPLVAGHYAFVYLDLQAPAGSWYRTRYSKATPALPADYSDYGPAWQGDAPKGLVCNVQDVRRRMKKAATDHEDDDVIAAFCEQVTTEITTLTGRQFWPLSGVTMVFDGDEAFDGGRTLYIPRGVRAITSVKVRYLTGDTQVTIDPKYYRLQPGDNRRPYGWPYMQVEMTDLSPYRFNWAAYDSTEMLIDTGWSGCPADIHEPAVNAVVRAIRAKAAGQTDAVGTSSTGQAIILRQFSPAERARLDFYRDPDYR